MYIIRRYTFYMYIYVYYTSKRSTGIRVGAFDSDILLHNLYPFLTVSCYLALLK